MNNEEKKIGSKKKSKKKYSWFNVSNVQRKEFEELCPVNEFRIVKPSELPSIIPEELRNKFDSVLIVASGSSSNNVAYYMINGNRVDFKDNSIDQEPFGLAFIGEIAAASGSLIHHGDWKNRTTEPPDEFWDYVSASEIGNCYPLSELPTEPSGSIKDLNVISQKEAFKDLITQIKRFMCEK